MQLPADIYDLILKQLNDISPTCLLGLRLVCNQFYALATPLIYRRIRLNDRIVNDFRDLPPRGLGASNICLYAQYITITKPIPWKKTLNLFRSLREFKGLELVSWGKGTSAYRPIERRVLDAIKHQWPGCRLSLDASDLPYGSCRTIISLKDHTSRLVSCKVQNWYNTDQRSLFRDVILKSTNLKVLHLLSSPSGHCSSLSPAYFDVDDLGSDIRLPAISELYLQGYNWNHTPKSAVHFWNWTNLTCLDFERVDVLQFLRTVTPNHLVQLKTFITDGYCNVIQDRTQAMYYINKLLEHVIAVETLSLTCHIAMLDMTSTKNTQCTKFGVAKIQKYNQ